ncbi:hypothetical protein O1W71_02085 [Microbacterium sp. H37-C3]|uniref:hypothetical protein n=1 Tax=Microbacterium sp. H37-C3 TaxID=3004354 RepID=UPI0022AF40E5|nr:hypothetical protein [Microbacterium sp. H37-C3]MCZ4066457.1 hypothetical protein [Microbacterium sp. H37-C3]
MSDAPMTAQEVRALADGTRIIVLWSGGNGPHEYRLVQGAFGMQYACPPAHVDRPHLRERNPLEFIGSEQWQTKVWLAGSSPTGEEQR